jgi:hypothetical protein
MNFYFYLASVLANVVVCSGWFLGARLFYQHTAPDSQRRESEFFARMQTPVPDRADHEGEDRRQRTVLGKLSLVYGGAIMMMALIPNPLEGRLCFLFCGGVVAGTGWCLRSP